MCKLEFSSSENSEIGPVVLMSKSDGYDYRYPPWEYPPSNFKNGAYPYEPHGRISKLYSPFSFLESKITKYPYRKRSRVLTTSMNINIENPYSINKEIFTLQNTDLSWNTFTVVLFLVHLTEIQLYSLLNNEGLHKRDYEKCMITYRQRISYIMREFPKIWNKPLIYIPLVNIQEFITYKILLKPVQTLPHVWRSYCQGYLISIDLMLKSVLFLSTDVYKILNKHGSTNSIAISQLLQKLNAIHPSLSDKLLDLYPITKSS